MAVNLNTIDPTDPAFPSRVNGAADRPLNTRPQVSRLLVVDDDLDMGDLLQSMLSQEGYEVVAESEPGPALERAMREDFAVVLADLKLGADSGLDLCRELVAHRPSLPVVVVTGYGSMDAAVDAIRAGAYDFITKPLDRAQLKLTLRRAAKHHHLVDELTRLRDQRHPADHEEMVGDSAAMRRTFDLIERVAPTDASVLVLGESGSGKELIARAIHARSERRNGPFIAINCGAVTATLLESELFGHVRGAFTDARSDKKGLFLEADGGTVFLDEIGEMPLDMQTKLLRVLQERTVRPVGSQKEIPFDTRVVAATNRDLEEDVVKRRFREDLFYRINVVTIPVAPLRERGTDVLKLAQYFLEQAASDQNKGVHGISTEAATKLLEYDWPGNVRQLQNCMERAVILTRFDKLTVDDLPERIRSHQTKSVLADDVDAEYFVPLSDLERRYIKRALEIARGNKTKAAKMLGLDRRTLYRKLDRYEEQDRQAALQEATVSNGAPH